MIEIFREATQEALGKVCEEMELRHADGEYFMLFAAGSHFAKRVSE